ncbi:restriction endonuclease subunit S [Pediococcus acidilactici]|uniref:restriction endonuclease subunit S n=1 Tax=Pediococcus acidilactici TaxID=1254 RepID=UPI0006B65E9D|nr:hypothetical protein AN404_04830 [Pediococcus acidilactici]
MSEEKNVPNIRFKGFTDPWEQRKLGSAYEITMGQSPNSNNYTKNPNDFILVQGNADIKNGRVVPRMWTKQITKLANPGDIILSVRAPVGDVGITNYTVVLGRGVASISGDDFIYQTLIKMKTFGFWRKFSTGSTFESINSKDIKNAVILVPIANERRNIGTIFKSVDATIALHQQKVTQLKELKKLLMQKIFDQEWRFRGFTDPWEQRKLGDVSSKVTEKNKSKKYTETLTNSAEYGIINQYAFFDKSISNSNSIASYYVVKRDNFVYNPRISTAAPVGPINRNRLNIIGIMSPLYYVFEATNIDKSYLEYYFKTTKWHNFMKIEGNTGARSDRLAIKDKVLVKMPIPYPKVKEQKQIGELFESIDTTIALHQQKVDQLKELKKYLMQNLFV